MRLLAAFQAASRIWIAPWLIQLSFLGKIN
jgi:hypothetical protein